MGQHWTACAGRCGEANGAATARVAPRAAAAARPSARAHSARRRGARTAAWRRNMTEQQNGQHVQHDVVQQMAQRQHDGHREQQRQRGRQHAHGRGRAEARRRDAEKQQRARHLRPLSSRRVPCSRRRGLIHTSDGVNFSPRALRGRTAVEGGTVHARHGCVHTSVAGGAGLGRTRDRPGRAWQRSHRQATRRGGGRTGLGRAACGGGQGWRMWVGGAAAGVAGGRQGLGKTRCEE